jgi:hypothetical protein
MGAIFPGIEAKYRNLCQEFDPESGFACDYPRGHVPLRVSKASGVLEYAHGSQRGQVWWGPVPAVPLYPEPPVEKTHREKAQAALRVALTPRAATSTEAPGTQIMMLMGIGEALLALEETIRTRSEPDLSDEHVATTLNSMLTRDDEPGPVVGCKSVRDGKLPCPERFNRGERAEDRARWCRFCKATVPDYDPKPRNYEQERGF